jgi:hypothetical protein
VWFLVCVGGRVLRIGFTLSGNQVICDSSSLRCRSLACESLRLLQSAVGSSVPAQFLQEEVWGSIIGMFELNNLAVQVQSPLELFFLAADELPEEEQAAVQSIIQPWLDALDTDYDVCCSVCPSQLWMHIST